MAGDRRPDVALATLTYSSRAISEEGQVRVSISCNVLMTTCYPVTMKAASVNGSVRERVRRSRQRFWRPEDFDGSPEAVAQALSRLERSGELRRVRRGLYWRGMPTRLGMSPPPAHNLVHEVVGGPGTGPAGRSASLALGLSTQVPKVEVVAVPGRAPKNPVGINFVSRASSEKRREERLRPTEIALLEVLRDWQGLVEAPLGEALRRIERLISNGDIRMDRVVRASATEPPRTRERLRRLLIKLGRENEAHGIAPARSESVRSDLALAG